MRRGTKQPRWIVIAGVGVALTVAAVGVAVTPHPRQTDEPPTDNGVDAVLGDATDTGAPTTSAAAPASLATSPSSTPAPSPTPTRDQAPPAIGQAVSQYSVVERYPGASLVEIRLITGKRNQIRIQARLRGHMLVGEQRYVFGPDTLRSIDFGRQALHAASLRIDHPVTGRPLEIEAPLPRDLRELIAALRRGGLSDAP